MNNTFSRCQVVPLPEHQVSLQVEGVERLRWHYGAEYPRPFFFPLVGPSGSPLTRMGHPGAPNHDHHRSIWFAHHKLLGIDFWSDQSPAVIRQKQWLCYRDGDDQAVMAVELEWFDGHDPQPLLQQQVIAALRPDDAGGAPQESLLELQSTLTPVASTIEFGKTNFGLLAVRMAKSISAHFGGGQLTNSEGAVGEPAIFGKPASWVDYSGPVPDQNRRPVVEGITYHDHPDNPGFPCSWHVREDGWMGCSLCMHGPLEIKRDKPLVLRYLLHAHAGPSDAEQAARVADGFHRSRPFEVKKATAKHEHLTVERS